VNAARVTVDASPCSYYIEDVAYYDEGPMALPVQSIRARPEHRDILQSVADLLREGREPAVRRLLDDAKARSVGPFRDEAAALTFLRDRLVLALKPRAIWQFGSRARGDAEADSDFDLLVVLPDGLPAEAYSVRRAAESVAGCGLGYDIVPCSLTEFRKDREVPGSLVQNAVTEGTPIYRDRRWRKAERAA
jgi:Nucleotidyltransferase domain